jgi:hypothetical protein
MAQTGRGGAEMRPLKERSRAFAQQGFKSGSTIALWHDDSLRENPLAFDLASGVLESTAQHESERPFLGFFKCVYVELSKLPVESQNNWF